MSFNVEKLDIDVDSIIECVDEPQMDTKMQIGIYCSNRCIFNDTISNQ